MTSTPWDDDSGAGAVSTVNGQSGDVTLTAGDVGADPTGTASAALSNHVAEADPHAGYQLRAEAGQPNGYAQLDASGLVLQDPTSAAAVAAANAIAKAGGAGKLSSGWGGAANSLATLDSGGLVPTAQQGSGSPDATTFLRGDRAWVPALQGNLGGTDNVLVRADGTGGRAVQGSAAILDDSANLTLGSRSFHQPLAASAWSGATSTHDMALPTWPAAPGQYVAFVRVRVQQNSTTFSFSARSHQIELTYSGTFWTVDGALADPSLGALSLAFGWSITGGSTLRLSLSGLGASNAGNVGMILEQFLFYGAL